MASTRTKGNRARRHARTRAKISGTEDRPRLSVFKSNTMLYASLIDDVKGATLAATKGKDATKVGTDLASLAGKKKIEKAVFDRSGYIYTGKVKTLAEAARAGGLKF
ncbi:MAG: 50S ribosomal protein L18 [Parcubacteria group bacterium]